MRRANIRTGVRRVDSEGASKTEDMERTELY